MYSFFDLSSTKAARVMAGAGAVIITVILVAGHFAANQVAAGKTSVPLDTALLGIGALA